MPNLASNRWFNTILQILLWIAFLILPFALGDFDKDMPFNNGMPLIFKDSSYTTVLIYGNLILIPIFYLNYHILIPKLFIQRGLLWYLLSIIILGAIWLTIITPLGQLLFLDSHKLSIPMRARMFPFVLIMLISFAVRLAGDKLKDEKHKEEQAKMNYQSELAFLRSQISPHFLFNIMNNVVALSRVKPQLVEPTLIKLSSLMRYMLYESDENKVSLESELEYLESYIDLQKMRFGNAVNIVFNKNTEGSNFDIEPMLLIPFVENAFKHGVTMVENPEIKIDFKTENNQLNFNALNKFDPLSTEIKDGASGIGLKNVSRRLDLLYPNQHKLNITTEGGIFAVNLTIRMNRTQLT